MNRSKRGFSMTGRNDGAFKLRRVENTERLTIFMIGNNQCLKYFPCRRNSSCPAGAGNPTFVRTQPVFGSDKTKNVQSSKDRANAIFDRTLSVDRPLLQALKLQRATLRTI